MNAFESALSEWAVSMAGLFQRFGFVAFLLVAAALLVLAIVRGEAGLLKFFDHIGAGAFALVMLVSVVAVVVMTGMADPWGFLIWWCWVAGIAAGAVYWRSHGRWLGYWLLVSIRFLGLLVIARVTWLFTRPVGGRYVGWTLMSPKLARQFEK